MKPTSTQPITTLAVAVLAGTLLAAPFASAIEESWSNVVYETAARVSVAVETFDNSRHGLKAARERTLKDTKKGAA